MNDIELWHSFVEFAKKLEAVSKIQELDLIRKCQFYLYDSGACEEYCDCPNITRTTDFHAEKECWNCTFCKIKDV